MTIDGKEYWVKIRGGWIVGMRTGDEEFEFEKPLSVNQMGSLVDSLSFLDCIGMKSKDNDAGRGKEQVVDVGVVEEKEREEGDVLPSGLRRFSNLPLRTRIKEIIEAGRGLDGKVFRANDVAEKLGERGFDVSVQVVGALISSLGLFEKYNRDSKSAVATYKTHSMVEQAYKTYLERLALVSSYIKDKGSFSCRYILSETGLNGATVNIGVYHDAIADKMAERSMDKVRRELGIRPPSVFVKELGKIAKDEKENKATGQIEMPPSGFCRCGAKQVDECGLCTIGVCKEHIATTVTGEKTRLEYNICSLCVKENGSQLGKRVQAQDAEFYEEFKDEFNNQDQEKPPVTVAERTSEEAPVKKGMRFLHVYERKTPKTEDTSSRRYGHTIVSQERFEELKARVKKHYDEVGKPSSKHEIMRAIGITPSGSMNQMLDDICKELGVEVPRGKRGRKPRNTQVNTHEVEQAKATVSLERADAEHGKALLAMLGEIPPTLGEDITGVKGQQCYVIRDGYVACRPRRGWVPFGGVCDTCPNRVKTDYTEAGTKYVVCDKED